MLSSVLIEGLIYAIMVLGVFITFRILDFPDLTVDGSFATGACVAAFCIINGVDMYFTLIAVLFAGVLAGVFTALLHTLLKIPNLLAGIITMTMLYSINTRINSGKSYEPFTEAYKDNMIVYAVSNKIISFLNQFGITFDESIVGSVGMFIFFLIFVFYIKLLIDIFFRTDLGISLGALGSNEQMILSQGMNPNTLKIIGVGLSNGLVALSGALYAEFMGSANIQSGQGIIVIGLAAVMIGEFVIRSNKIWLITIGVVIGSIIYKGIVYLGINYGYKIGFGPNDLKLITGLLIIIIIMLSYAKKQKKGTKTLVSKNSMPSFKDKIIPAGVRKVLKETGAFISRSVDLFIDKTYKFWFGTLYLVFVYFPFKMLYTATKEGMGFLFYIILAAFILSQVLIVLFIKKGNIFSSNKSIKKYNSAGVNKRSEVLSDNNLERDHSDDILVLENIDKSFFEGTPDEKHVLKGLSLTIKKGDFITIIGSNGAGKSTLFNVIAGTYKASRGKILYKNRNITKMKEYLKAHFIGRIFQNPLLGTSGEMALEDNMILCRKKGFKLPVISLNKEIRKDFANHVSRLNMGLENRLSDNVGLFSGGQRQALTLLMTALSHPELVLLDEHTAALDPDNSNRVMDLTLKLREEYGLTMMMITHNMQHAIKYGNRLLMMDNGEIILDISGEEKKNLTVEALMEKFKAIRKDEITDEKLLLAR